MKIAQIREKISAVKETAPILAFLLAGLFVAAAAISPVANTTPAFNNVQIFVNTASQGPYSFYFSAYNLTGSLVASTQTPYPAAAFELPAGSYLFTVSALGQGQNYCRLCMEPMKPGADNGSGTTTSSGSTGMPVPSPVYYAPPAEYGFKVEQVSGPDSFTISTMNVTQYPTSPVTVKVQYANGTAVQGAYVSASIIGEWYYWWGQGAGVNMSGQTDSSGVANLVLPQAPAVISAWKWVAINLTQSQKTVQVNIGGETINVTAYWEPTYVGLAATGLLLPPANSIQLTLTYQQPTYWVMPYGGMVQPSAGQTSGAAVSDKATGVPSQTEQSSTSQYYLPSVIPSMGRAAGSNGAATISNGFWGSSVLEAAMVTAAAVVAAGAVALALRRQHPTQ